MTATTLSERLQVMAVVDHRRMSGMVADELLDIPRRKKEIAEALRTYYSARGVVVSEDQLQEAISEVFARRLTPEPHRLSSWAMAAANGYVQRAQWGPRVIRITAGASALLVAVMIGQVALLSWRMRELRADFGESIAQVGPLRVEADAAVAEAQQLAATPAQYANHALEVGLAHVQQSQAKLNAQIRSITMDATKIASLEVGHTLVTTNTEATHTIAQEVGRIRDTVQQMRRLSDADRKLTQAINSQGFAELGTKHKEAALSVALAQTALTNGADGAPAAVATALSTIERAERVEEEAATGLEDAKALLAADLDREERDEVQALMQTLTDASKRMDLDAASKSAGALHTDARLLQQPLQLKIVSRQSERSGVERSFSSGGKRWYLIVEAVDGTGQPFPLRIKNDETGSVDQVTKFGVAVPADVYAAVKADKKADGIVDDAVVGSKPAGRLRLSFAKPVVGGYITNW